MALREVLERIAADGPAMSMLDSEQCAVEPGRPPKIDAAGRLVVDDDGIPVDPGTRHRTLGDLVREALGQDG